MLSWQALHLKGLKPKEKHVFHFVSNCRKRDKNHKGKGKQSTKKWNLADFQLLAQTMRSVKDKSLHGENTLLLANAHLSDEFLCVTLVNPALLTSIWRRMRNKSYVKIGTDGVYKLFNQEFSFATFGFLLKVAGGASDYHSGSSKHVFPTTYREVFYALMRTEHQVPYGRLFADFDVVMQEVLNVQNFSSGVGQFHGDYHGGLMAAVRRQYRLGRVVGLESRLMPWTQHKVRREKIRQGKVRREKM